MSGRFFDQKTQMEHRLKLHGAVITSKSMSDKYGKLQTRYLFLSTRFVLCLRYGPTKYTKLCTAVSDFPMQCAIFLSGTKSIDSAKMLAFLDC